MGADWKDALAALKGSVPEADVNTPEDSIPEEPNTVKKGKVSIAKEKKGRGGKTATIIYGFECSDEELSETASALRHRLGTGGSARGGEILLQGDVVEKVKPILKEMGYRL